MPVRVQVQSWRKPGGRKPQNVVIVSRPSRYGNPFAIGKVVCTGSGRDYEESKIETRADAVAAFEAMLNQPDRNYPGLDQIIRNLRGKDLACYCPLDQPCHADVLLRVANDGDSSKGAP